MRSDAFTRMAVFLALLSFSLHAATASPGEPSTVRSSIRTMGTIGTVSVVSSDSLAASAAIERALSRFLEVDARLSNWDPQSELSRANRALEGGSARLSTEAAFVVGAALEIARESQGAFDPTVEPLVRAWGFLRGVPRVPSPRALETARARVGYQNLSLDVAAGRLIAATTGMRVDLGGIAKGYAVDLAVEELRAAGIDHALIDLSGNMRGLGHPQGRESWAVGIRDPDRENSWFARLTLEQDAIATSGNYEQFVSFDGRRLGHVLDPRSGWPAEGLDAVTVLSPDALHADAWATALLVMGPEQAREWASDRANLHAVLVQSAVDGRRVIWVERALSERFELVTGSNDRFEVRWF